MSLKSLVFIALLMLCSFFVSGQSSCDEPLNFCFEEGEVLDYELVYNWGFIWASAGEVTFSVKPIKDSENDAFHFHGYGHSKKSWDWFYKVRSTYQSWTDENLKPSRFIREGQEGSNHYHNDYQIIDNSAMLSSQNEDGKIETKEIALKDCFFDIISAIYFCRSLPFENYEMDEIVPLNLLLDGACHDSYLRFKGRDECTDRNSGVSYQCLKFSPLLIQGTVFEEGENMMVYVTDDEKRLPVYIETDLVVGKAKVFLLNSFNGSED